MADERPVELGSQGPPETVLDPPPEEARAALEEALSAPEDQRQEAIARVAARWPRYVEAWASLGEHSRGISAYAYYRVGYHRGLDQLRQSGWRGSGYVRSRHPTNRGFLRALDGLRAMAEEIGELDEAERCAGFLRQLDPDPERDSESPDR